MKHQNIFALRVNTFDIPIQIFHKSSEMNDHTTVTERRVFSLVVHIKLCRAYLLCFNGSSALYLEGLFQGKNPI